jgi:hypothetical protein
MIAPSTVPRRRQRSENRFTAFSGFAIYLDRVEQGNRLDDIDTELVRAERAGTPGPQSDRPGPVPRIGTDETNATDPPIQLLLSPDGIIITESGTANPFSAETLTVFDVRQRSRRRGPLREYCTPGFSERWPAARSKRRRHEQIIALDVAVQRRNMADRRRPLTSPASAHVDPGRDLRARARQAVQDLVQFSVQWVVFR